MLFCMRKMCPAGEVVVFDMKLGFRKWRVKNFTAGPIDVSFQTFDECDSTRISPEWEQVIADRDRRTGNYKTTRRICVRAVQTGTVEIIAEG